MFEKFKKTGVLFLFSCLPAFASLWLIFAVLSPTYATDMPRRYFYFIFLFSLIISGSLYLWVEKGEKNIETLCKKTLLVFLPTQVIFLFAFKNHSLSFHTFIHLFLNLYLISAFLFAVVKYLKFRKKNKMDDDENEKKIPFFHIASFWGLAAAIAVAAVFFSFGFLNLGKFAAVDEPLWTFNRIAKFWSNVADGEFHKTMISDKPGITVALISGPALKFLNPHEYKPERKDGYLINAKNDFEEFNFFFRFPLLLFSALMLPVFYLFILKLTNVKTALFSTVFISTSPVILGISTIVNPDALLWIFLPLSVISYFVYLKRSGNKFYLFAAGVFMGLGLLTKYITNILAVYFLIIFFLEAIMSERKTRQEFNRRARLLLIDYLTLILTALFTAFLLLPAGWSNASRLLEITVWSEAFRNTWLLFVSGLAIIAAETFILKNKALYFVAGLLAKKDVWLTRINGIAFIFLGFFSILNVWLAMKWYDFEAIISSPKTSHSLYGFFGFFTANFYSLVFGIAPITLFFIFYASFRSIFAKNRDSGQKWVVYFFFFILIYYFASALNSVSATVRYQISVFPIALVIAGFGISLLIADLKIQKRWILGAIVALVFMVSLRSINSIRPFYFSYASDLLPKKYVLNLKDMGDGSFEAAEYLNNMENSENLRVWTDKRGVCYFLKGKCSVDVEFEQKIKFDYFVISAGRKNRIEKLFLAHGARNAYPMDFRKLYEIENMVFNLEIGDRPNNYVRIISAEEFNKKTGKQR